MGRVEILGVPFANLHYHELFDELDRGISSGSKQQICFVPSNSILAAQKDQAAMIAYQNSAYVICDAVPVKWASSFLGKPLKERITGFDFFPDFISHAAKKGYRIFLLGAKDGVAEQLKKKYSSLYPSIQIVGVYSPPFAQYFSEAENRKMIDMINQSSADVLFVSLTAPKQDIWIHDHLDQLNVKIAAGVGAAFDAENGSISRAPKIMQQMGMEWFYRFLQEPKRLFRRYFLEAPVFLWLIFKEKFTISKNPTSNES